MMAFPSDASGRLDPMTSAPCDRCNIARLTGRAQCREHARQAAIAAGEPDALAQLDRAIATAERRADRDARRFERTGGAVLPPITPLERYRASGAFYADRCPPGEHLDGSDGQCLACGEWLEP
jgi:hypothetical protein